ncbi:MAG: cobalamin-binding protein [Candidatus Lokiarchaeota archaeon]|nr:cobalamin-binding protein [Candidatus Lokiarchaeota archaeon]MBD3200793.1 cobalamin-binding protein [Candidatus Lokiarchaeota archaeon]
MSSKVTDRKVYSSIVRNISQDIEKLSKKIYKRIFDKLPHLNSQYSNTDKRRSYEDIQYHLNYLSHSIHYTQEALFNEYIRWTKSLLLSRNLSRKSLVITFESMKEILEEKFPTEKKIVNLYLDNAISIIKDEKRRDFSYINDTNDHKEVALKYLDYVLNGKKREADTLIRNLISQDIDIKDIYIDIFQPVQQEIGRLWETNQINVAQEHYSTAVTQLIISRLYDKIFSSEKIGNTLIATCIGGELHELGIRMIADFFEMEGWDTYYLGANTPIDSIISSIINNNADLLAVSATIMIHVSTVEEMIIQIRKTEAKNVKIMVGGYPFNIVPNLWEIIGADAFATDAQSAIKTASKLLR